MCNQFTFHHQFRIDTGRSKFEQTTDSILSACGSHGTKNTRDPDIIDLEAPRLAWYMHDAWNKHQNTVYWVDIKLAQKKGLKFYQTRSNAIILYNTLPAYCIPKVVRMETGEIIFEKVYESPRPPPKISLRDDLDEGIGFRSCSTSRSQPTNQPNQTQIQIMIERRDPL